MCVVQRRLSFGSSMGVSTPKKVNMSRRLSIASDSSMGSGPPRMHDCLLGQLHSAYSDLCKKVGIPDPSRHSAAYIQAFCCMPYLMSQTPIYIVASSVPLPPAPLLSNEIAAMMCITACH